MKTSKRKGFTIIELLVSIAIIGMLFSVVMASLGGLKEKSRDSRRMSDVKEISKALTLYVDSNIVFPIVAGPVIITGSDAVSIALESEGMITKVPIDPLHPANVYTYESDSTGSTFTISFCLETDTIPNYSQGCGNTITP
jgi:prepilin-type N-terminal cleavage/methylation domain-containing protein